MTMWDDPRKLIGWTLVLVSANPIDGWITLTFAKGRKRAHYSFSPAAARPLDEAERTP